MCWQMALGIGSTAMEYIGGVQSANQQNQYYMDNAAAANANASEKYAAEQLSLVQKEEQATEQRMALRRSAIESTGSALASTENFGQSTDQTLLDIDRQRARQTQTVDTNIENERIQSKANMEGIQSEAENRINSVQTASGPDLISTIISGLGNTLGYMDSTKGTKDTGVGTHNYTKGVAIDANYVDPAAFM